MSKRAKYMSDWHIKNRESILEKQRRYRIENKEEIFRKRKEKQEELNTKNKIYYLQNKETIKEKHKQYRSDNKDICNYHSAAYRAIKYKATARWLSEEDMWMIREIYSLASLRSEITGIGWEVDHIIPLRGERVCGLHTPNNLQIITACENKSKGNKYVVVY